MWSMEEVNVYLSPFVNASVSHLAEGGSEVCTYVFTQNTRGENMGKLLLIRNTTHIAKIAL